MKKLLKSKGFTIALCTILNVLCMIVCLVSVFYNKPTQAKQVKTPLSARSELPRNQVIVYRIYYNDTDSPTIKVEQGNADDPVDLKGNSHGG